MLKNANQKSNKFNILLRLKTHILGKCVIEKNFPYLIEYIPKT